MRLGAKGQRFFILDYETTGLSLVNDDPIEVGIIVTDEHFNLVETYESLIKPKDFDTWTAKQLHAFKVHGIHPSELAKGQEIGFVALQLQQLGVRHTSKTNQKPVLVSDNIQFEWGFTKKIFSSIEWGEKTDSWPFHYCGWDSSLFLEATGVGDPKPAHRAMQDAGLLHAAILKGMSRVGK